jgi:hypothetical protein
MLVSRRDVNPVPGRAGPGHRPGSRREERDLRDVFGPGAAHGRPSAGDAERPRRGVRARQRLDGAAGLQRNATERDADPRLGADVDACRLHGLRHQPSRDTAVRASGTGRRRAARDPLRPAPRETLRRRPGTVGDHRRIVGRASRRPRDDARRSRHRRRSRSGESRARNDSVRRPARGAARPAHHDRRQHAGDGRGRRRTPTIRKPSNSHRRSPTYQRLLRRRCCCTETQTTPSPINNRSRWKPRSAARAFP